MSDSKHPENEGKVFLFRYGKKIFDKIMAAMQPEFEDETPINPFDFWEGANFKLKIRKVAGYWNYDSSDLRNLLQYLKMMQRLKKYGKLHIHLQSLLRLQTLSLMRS